jgi:hypothetical protein
VTFILAVCFFDFSAILSYNQRAFRYIIVFYGFWIGSAAIPAGHDAWVVGDEPVVAIEMTATGVNRELSK